MLIPHFALLTAFVDSLVLSFLESSTSKMKMAEVIVSSDSFGLNICVLRITGHRNLVPFSLVER